MLNYKVTIANELTLVMSASTAIFVNRNAGKIKRNPTTFHLFQKINLAR